MRQVALVIMAIAFLTACGDNSGRPASPSSSGSPNQPTLAPVINFVKATSERPPAIPLSLAPFEPCAIDLIDNALVPAGVIPVRDKTKLTLEGWAGLVATGTSPTGVILELEASGKYYLKANHGIRRPDVADGFGKPGLVDSGWKVSANLTDVPVGTYKIRIIQLQGQIGLICDFSHSLMIK